MINQAKLDPQIKQTVVEALIKVVENAPTIISASNGNLSNSIAQSRFDIWMNYVNSILRITSRYVDASLCFTVRNNIQNIATQSGLDYATRTNDICQIILDFARKILYL